MTRYSQIYIDRGPPASDSVRLRKRIASFIENRFNEFSNNFAVKKAIVFLVHEDIGVDVPYHGGTRNLSGFLETSEIRDFLDSVTIIHQVIRAQIPDPYLPVWQQFITRAMEEENVAYRIDDDGIVHPFIDPEFEANRSATVAALGQTRFGEARHGFEDAFRHLRNGEGRQAIRMMFPAVETAAKVLYPGRLARLEVSGVQQVIAPRLVEKYSGNDPAITAGRSLLKSFEQWIVASQPYRHGQEVQAPAEPPKDIVVAHLSAGATFLRWMIALSE